MGIRAVGPGAAGFSEPLAEERETALGWDLDHAASRGGMGQSPYPGPRGLNPLPVHLPEMGSCGLELIPVHATPR